MNIAPVSELLPGETPPELWTPTELLLAFSKRFLVLFLLMNLSLPLWLPYLALRPWMGRPPHVPTAGRFFWFLGRILGEQPCSGPIGMRIRSALLLGWAQQLCLVPIFGMAWYLDRLLYGSQLDGQKIVAPFFELSAARSGSTQLAHHLEEDPHFVAPNLMQFLAMHLGTLAMGLGANVMRQTLSATRNSPWTVATWEQDLPDYIEAIGKKLLLWRGEPCRLMIKGHFLGSAEALERRFPDALFMTMIRDPAKRIQSTLNFHRCQPGDGLVGPPRWSELVAYDLPEEITYCKDEQQWFMYGNRKNRMVIRFEDYRRDLPGSLRRVYQELLGMAERPQPAEHASRKRSGYSVDRSLEQMGVDPAALEVELADYRRWCAGEDAAPRTSG